MSNAADEITGNTTNDTVAEFYRNANIDDRCDVKWSHPLLKSVYATSGIEQSLGYLLDPENSLEEVQSFRKTFLDMIVESGEEFMSERHKEIRHKGTFSEYTVPGLNEDDPKLRTRIWIPNNPAKKKLPVLFHIHGGALANGSIEMCESEAMFMCRDENCALVSTSYRWVPDHQYPAQLDDLTAQYLWVLQNATDLGLNPRRIIVTGASSGGTLTLSLLFRLKRRGIQMARAAIVLWPLLDDRQMTNSSRYKTNMLDNLGYRRMWGALLGERAGRSDIEPEAVPGHARLEDFVGLCPVSIHCCENEVDRDDVIRFVQGLLSAGVFTDFHIWPGAGHLSIGAATSAVRDRFETLVLGSLSDFIAYDLARPWLDRSAG